MPHGFDEKEILRLQKKIKKQKKSSSNSTSGSVKSGIIYSDLSAFKKEIDEMGKYFPEVLAEFLKESGKCGIKILKGEAKSRVKPEKINYKMRKGKLTKITHYHKSFKRKTINTPYQKKVTIYNAAPHAHLIEDGHLMVGHKPNKKQIGFVEGKKVFKISENEIQAMFEYEAGKMISEYFDL